MNTKDKDMNEIIDSDFDEGGKVNWIVRTFSIILVVVDVIVLVKVIPVITGASDVANTPEPVDDIVELPVYEVENMESLHLDATEFDIRNYYIRHENQCGNYYYIDGDNVLWGCGDYSYGQLGNGKQYTQDGGYDDSEELTPQRIAENVVHVDFGNYFAIYLTDSGDLYGMGANLNGVMGLDTLGEDYVSFPEKDAVASTPVLLMQDVRYARASSRGIVALKNDGSVWWWGEIRTTSAKHIDATRGCVHTEPTKMLDNAIYVTCGYFTMAAIKEDGTLWTWGNNTFGSCGYDSKNQDFIEEPVKVLDDVKMVWIDEVRFDTFTPYDPEGSIPEDDYDYTYVTFAEKKDGSLYACGKNVDGEGSKIWDFKLYGDIIRDPNETNSNSEYAPVELVYSDRFQPIQFKEKQ